jgi:hypothetical protein
MNDGVFGTLWQLTRSGVVVPARGTLVVPTKYAPAHKRLRGRVEGPAVLISQRPATSVSYAVPVIGAS